MLGFAAFALVMAVVMLVVRPKPIVGLDLSQRQDAETALYLVLFGLILPLSLAVSPRLVRTIAAGPNAAGLSLLAGLLASALLAAVVVVRLSGPLPHGGGMGALLLATAAWGLAATAAFVRATRPVPWRPLLCWAGRARFAWALTGVLLLGAVLAVTHVSSLSPLGLLLSVTTVVTALLIIRRRGLPRLGRPWTWLLDALVALMLLLVIPDLVIIEPEAAAATPLAPFVNPTVHFHHDFLLGPVNQVLSGSVMLVDAASQYGVGSIYFLAGWFKLAPIGYGTLGLLDGMLTALLFVAGYCVLRLAGTSRLLAAATLALGVMALVFNRVYPVGALPQSGPLRFGLPMALILATVAALRWPRRSRPLRAGALAVLALSSIWALEAFAYTAATFVAMAGFEAYALPAGMCARWLARQVVLALGGCVCAHLALAGATLVAAGRLPDWGQYLAYVEAFVAGSLSDVTYDFSRWSPGLAVGAAYLASAAALVLVVRGRGSLLARERPTLLALTGVTAYGTALFSYFVDRSGDHLLAYVSLPALLAAALWLGLLLRARPGPPAGAREAALALALSVGALLVAVAWSSIGPRFERSALAKALPGEGSAAEALRRLWRFPALDQLAPQGQRLLERYMPRERRSLVLVKPNLGTEILLRSERANRLPLGDPWEDSLVPQQRLPGLRTTIAHLAPGERLLVDREMLARLRADPRSDQLPQPRPGESHARLQVWVMRQIGQRFRLQPLHRDAQGFVVVELAPRG